MPITQERFDRIKQKYWSVASWAIWADAGVTAKSNVGDLRVLDPDFNPQLLQVLKPNVVFVGLNISRHLITKPFANFHDERPQSTDFKIRFALKETPFWGGYMTDIVKDYEEKASGKLTTYLRQHPDFEHEHVRLFLNELSEVTDVEPTLIAFGNAVHAILARNVGRTHRILKVRHYAAYMSQALYRADVQQRIP